MEDETLSLSHRSGRSDDQSGHAAVPRATDGSADPIVEGRSHALGYRTGVGRQNDSRGRNRFGGSAKYVESRHAAAASRSADQSAFSIRHRSARKHENDHEPSFAA